MNQLRSIAKLLLPWGVKRFLRGVYRDYVFRRAMRQFLKAPEACTQPGSPVIVNLVFGWGNESWSAMHEYLAGCIEHALTSSGPILECGSGLSTILVGAVAKQRGLGYWALEHTTEWASKVQRYLDRYQISSATLCVRPLKDYGDFTWYDPPLESMPDSFSLVVCDGPPGDIKGGRYGLVPVMNQRLRPGCLILLDDAAREQERAIARRWAAELGASCESVGIHKPYIKMKVNGSQP